MRFTLPCKGGLYTDGVIGEEWTHDLDRVTRFFVFEARKRFLRRRNSGKRCLSEEEGHSLWQVLHYTELVGHLAWLLEA